MTTTLLRVRVTPRAGRDAIEGVREGVLRVRVAAPPVEGKANEAVTRLLARALSLAPRDVRVVRGETARDKVIAIDGLTEVDVWQKLGVAGDADGKRL